MMLPYFGAITDYMRIGMLEGRVTFLESHNVELRRQVIALQKERRELKRKLRRKKL